jgi:predicted nucleotidyltransferase
MKPSEALERHRKEIRQIAKQHHTCNPRVFGSVLHGNESEGSDLDLLVDPLPDTTLMDIARIQNQLQKLTGVTVDVLTPKALPKSFRDQVLSEALPV